MALILKGLSDCKTEALCRLPRATKQEMFVEFAVYARLPTFRFEYPGKYVVFNCKTLVHTFGSTLEEATNQHYGPPSPTGNRFYYQWLKPHD